MGVTFICTHISNRLITSQDKYFPSLYTMRIYIRADDCMKKQRNEKELHASVVV